MTYQLIAFDMDGTLLQSDQTIAPASLSAISQATAAGKQVILATGRPVSELDPYLPDLPSVRYGLLSSGAMIYDFHEQCVLDKTNLPKSIVDKLLTLIEKEPVFMVTMKDGQGYVQHAHFEIIDQFGMAAYRQLYRDTAVFVDNINEVLKNGTCEKVNIYFTTTERREQVLQELATDDSCLIKADEKGVEITALGADKGTALAKLCHQLKIPLTEVITVGDSANDHTMIRRAGLGLAMGNAKPSLKQLADGVLASNDEGGCAQAIQTYLLSQEH